MWQEIDEASRMALGRLLPGFFDIFDLDKRAWMEPDLYLLGFDRPRSLEIARESWLLDLVKVARIDTHGPTRDALVRSGWIDDQTPVA